MGRTSRRGKMISCLLLVTLASSDCVNVTQRSYQAEENQDITLEWTFSTNAHTSSEPTVVYCQLLTEDKLSVLYHLRDGVEHYQDEQFTGRVQCDRDVLREGQVRLHLSRLRTEDSGRYRCQVLSHGQWVSRECQLSITAAADQPETQTTTETPGPDSSGPPGHTIIGLYFALGSALAAGLVGVLVKFCRS